MNRFLESLTPSNCAFCLSDHQTGTMLAVQDIKLSDFRRNVLALAQTAKIHNIPVVLTASYAKGPNGPLMAELLAMFPESKPIYRPGPYHRKEPIRSILPRSFNSSITIGSRRRICHGQCKNMIGNRF